MGILRTDRVSGLGGANAITGSAFFAGGKATTTSSDYNLGTDDFTVECFVYFSGKHATLSTIFETRSSTSASDGFLLGRFQTSGHENKVEFYAASDYRVTADRTVENDTWVHIAVVRASATTKVYVDGTAYSSTYSDSNDYSNTEIIFGKNAPNSDQYQLTGFISNFHVVKGTAIYTANFTPPTNQIQKRSDTVFLGFRSASDVTREETGKIITFPISGHNSVSHGPDTSKSVISSRFTPNSPVGFSTTTDVGTQFGTTFDGVTTFDSQAYFVPPAGNTRERNRGRGLIMGGAVSPGATNTTQIKYFDIAAGGITEDFGQTTVARRAQGAVSSSIRGCVGGGFVSTSTSPHTVSNVIDFVTIASTGNAADFGDMQDTSYHYATASNQTRGLFAGGYRPNNGAVVNTIDLITIATTGNASNFGDLVNATRGFGGAASTTRGVFFGGTYPAIKDNIDFVTFSTTGDATDFGNLTDARDNVFGSSSSTRAVMGGGRDPNTTNIIDFITIASAGNATDFGDLTQTSYYFNAATGNSTRAVWVGTSTIVNSMEFVTIASTGNATDFGDQNGTAQHSNGAASDSHGGLS